MRLLMTNQQGGTLAQMSVSPDQVGLHRTLTGVVVHTVVTLLSRPNRELLLPFINMLTNPALLKVKERCFKLTCFEVEAQVGNIYYLVCRTLTCQQWLKTCCKNSELLEALSMVSR